MSTGLQTTEDIASGSDIISNPEEQVSPEKVLGAFNFALNKFRSEVNSKPPDQVSENDRQTLQAIEGAFQTSEIRVGANFEAGKFTYTNKITNPDGGPPILQEEGVPVEGLIKYLRTKLISLREDDPEKAQIEEALAILDKNSSKNYDAAHPGQKVDIDSSKGETDHPVMFARKSQESKLISQSSQATGSLEGDWDKALDRLRQRRELNVPRGIPTDQILRDIEEPEEEEEEVLPTTTSSTAPAVPASSAPSAAGTPPIAAPSLTAPGSADAPTVSPAPEHKPGPEKKPKSKRPGRKKPVVSSEPAPTTPNSDSTPDTTPASREPEHYTIDIISAQDALDTRAHLQATENVTAQIRRGRFYEFWHWPRKVGLRLIESGAVNIQTDRLREACLRNNTSFCESPAVKAATAAANGAGERQQLVERFKEGRVLTRGREQRVEAQGAMKQAVVNELLNPIINGTITDQNQLREALARFVRGHLNDRNNEIRTQVRELFGPQAQDFGTVAEYFATDLLEMGLRIKESTRFHRLGLAGLDQYIHINLGVAREASNTDTRSITDRAVAWARRRQNENLARGARYGVGFSGIIANPAVVGVATALGANSILRGVGVGVRAAAVTGFAAGAVSGAVVAGVRRWVELGKDRRTDLAQSEVNELGLSREQVQEQLRTMGGWRGRLLRVPGVARAAGLYRRADLQEFHYDWADTDQLRNGGGREIVERGGARRNAADLARLDMTVQANRDEVGRRIAEIEVRLNRGQRENMAWIRYADKANINSQVRELLDTRDRLRAVLQDATLENTWTTKWNKALEEDRRKKDSSFRWYRIRNTLGSAAFGAVAGVAFGLLSQKGFALARQAMGDTNVGNTILDNIAQGRPVDEWTSGGRAPGFAVDQSQELYSNPGNREVARDLMAATIRRDDGTVGLRFVDGGANVIPGPPGHVLENGSWVISGNPDNLPGQIRQVVEGEGWQSRPYNNPDFNISQKLQNLIQSGNREIFVHGNTIVSVDGAAGTVSMQDVPSGTNIYGHINTTDGSFVFDPKDPANNGVDWDVVRSRTGTEGWGVGEETIPGKPAAPITEAPPVAPTIEPSGKTVIDTLLSKSPEELRAQGIVETDQFKKTWNFHVLRPDIVDSTGQHTHRELALQLGGKFQVASGEFRTGAGVPGSLGFSDEIGKGLTPSHLPGVPAAEDKALSALIDRSGGLIKKSDMVYLIDLTDGRQITIPLVDNLGNSNLPPELFDSKTGGLHGVDTIAAAVLEKSDGTVLRAGELLNNGQVPEGTVVHSLASEKFLPIEAPPPPTPPPPEPPTPPEPEPPHTGVKLVPPPATEFVPPPAKELEQDLLIPIPFAPRHPLGPVAPGIDIPPPLPPTYYGGESLQETQRWLNSNPNAHKPYRRIKGRDGRDVWIDDKGNPVTRNTDREMTQISAFLDNLRETDPDHYSLLQKLAEQIPPMNEKTRVAVNIPAWMEGKNLYHLLEMYTKQVDKDGHPLDPSLYEINIIVNRKTGTPPDESVSEIERFRAEAEARGQRFQINYTDIEFPPPFNNVGNARRVITNLTLLRSLKRTHQTGQLYIESEDADLVHIDPKTVINLITRLDENPHLDAVRGIQDRFSEQMMQNDFLFLYRRMQDFKEFLIRRRAYRIEQNPRANFTWNRVITGGWNTGYTAEAYALIGGYNPYMTKGEDLIIGERMTMARGDGSLPNTDVVGKVGTRSDSSPRRYIYEVASGQAAYGPNFDDPAVNAEIRNNSPEELLDRISNLSRINNSNLPVFQSMLNNEYQFIRATTPNESEARKVAEFIMLYLGFKKEDYEFTSGGELVVRELSNVKAALEGYRVRHQAPRKPGQRTGYRTSAEVPPTRGELRETEKWAKKHHLGQGKANQQQIENWAMKEVEERRRIREMYPGNLPPLDPQPQWVKQGNRKSLLSSQLASTSNALRALGLYNPSRHNEQALLAILGGKGFAKSRPRGLSMNDIRTLLSQEAPNLTPRFSNSVSEILRAVASGAAAIIESPVAGGVALIPPGQRLSRRGDTLMVQIIDSKEGVRDIPVEELIQSNITLANTPGASPAYILEKTSAPSTPTAPPVSPTSPAPTPAPAPATPPSAPTSPATAPATPGRFEIASSTNLVQSFNRELAGQIGPFATADLKPQFVAEYLKSLEIPVATPVGQINAKVKKSHVSIIPAGPGSSPRLQIEGEIGAGFGPLGGGAAFKVQLENDPSGGVRIVNFNPDDPAQLRLSGQAKGQKDGIVSNISRINELLADQINKSLDPNWRSAGFQIERDNLAFGFQKRTTP